MKEAFGGVFLMRLLLVFIFIYLVFAAISYNYAQAFRLKNMLITYIEEKDINDFNEVLNAGDSKILQGIDDILDQSTYRVSCGNVEGLLPTEDPLEPQKFCYHGIVITTEEVGHLIHHNVSTFVYWNLPVLNTFLLHAANSENAEVVKDAAWEITGDAVVVKRTPEPEEDNRSQKIIEELQESKSEMGGNVSSGMGNNNGTNNAGTENDSSIDNGKRKYKDDPSIKEYSWDAYGDQELLKSLMNTCKYKYGGEYVDHEYVNNGYDKKGNPKWKAYLYCKGGD